MEPFPRYWATHSDVVDFPGTGTFDLRIGGYSFTSQQDAELNARERFDQLVARGGPRSEHEQYYPDRYKPEEVLEDVHSPDGELIAVVTRNRYGAAVLNTDAVMIIDIDMVDRPTASDGEGEGRRSGGLLSRLFGGRKREETGTGGAHGAGTAADADQFGMQGPGDRGEEHQRILTAIGIFGAAHPELGRRVYRTRNGFRVLVTGAGAGPTSDRARTLMRELDTDRLYLTLCRVHETYRARLTPKPWRIGIRPQNAGGPHLGSTTGYQRWVQRYTSASREYAVCRLVDASGPSPSAVEQQIIELHDRAVRPASQLRLA